MANKKTTGLSKNVLTLFTVLLVLFAIFVVVSQKNAQTNEDVMIEEELL